jgi:F-type H+-transporting ATPase subunit alpha
MVLTLFAVNNGYFDDIDVKKAMHAEKSLKDYIKSKYAALIGNIESTKNMTGDEETALKAAIEDWKKNGTY